MKVPGPLLASMAYGDGLPSLRVWHCIALGTLGHEAFLLPHFLIVHWFGSSLGKIGREVPCPSTRCSLHNLCFAFFFFLLLAF